MQSKLTFVEYFRRLIAKLKVNTVGSLYLRMSLFLLQLNWKLEITRMSLSLRFATCMLLSFASGLDWWEGGNFYQIYPRSYKDSDGDGVGDLQGIKSKIAYVKSLGMDGVWLSPIYKSPQADFGYDISDYRDIHYEYGTLQDFQELLDECNRLGLKLILDFVPNHTRF